MGGALKSSSHMDVPRVDLGMTRVPSVATLGLAHGPKIIFDKRKFPMLREFDRKQLLNIV